MEDGLGCKEKCDGMCMKSFSHLLPLQKEKATRELQLMLCVWGYSWLKWVIKISRGHRAGRVLHLFRNNPHWTGQRKVFKGQLLFFTALGLVGPQSPFACDPGNGIIRGRDGDQRPGEMNSGALHSHFGGMKVDRGWLMFIEAAAIKTLSRLSSPACPLF